MSCLSQALLSILVLQLFASAGLAQEGFGGFPEPVVPNGVLEAGVPPSYMERRTSLADSALLPDRTAEPTISFERLSRAPSEKARREYERAHRAIRQGDDVEAIQRFEKAIELHPEYVEAHHDLAVRLARMGRIREAVESFARAAELDRFSSRAQAHLAMAILYAGKPLEAETAARRAVELDDRNAIAHYVLGLALLQRAGAGLEAVESLVAASAHYPAARLIAVNVLLELDRVEEAKLQLRRFLRTGMGMGAGPGREGAPLSRWAELDKGKAARD